MNKIKYLSKKKVVILGSSLPMLILAYFLTKNKIDVKVVNDTNFKGGAWKSFKYQNIKIRSQSNVIVPINRKEENNQKKMNYFLKNTFQVKINKLNKKIITPYKFKNKFFYDFNLFLKRISNKKIFRKINVKEIKLYNNQIKINNIYTFDFMFVPTYFGIKEFNLNNKIIKTDFDIIKSEHVVALIKTKNFNNFYYSDFFNHFFDRAQFTREKNFLIFSARITKENKGSNINKILIEIKKLFYNNQIIYIKKFIYKNYYRNHNQILKLKKIDNYKSIKYLDTQSFMSFFIEFIKYFK